MNAHYTIHDLSTAPHESRPAIEATAARLGRVPNLVGAMAESPELLGNFFKMTAVMDSLTLTPLERETAAVTFGVEVGCRHCIGMHVMALKKLDAPAALIHALTANEPIAEPRLAVLRDFTQAVVIGRGAVASELQDAFFDRGFTARQALEVVFIVASLAMSSFASRLMEVPLDAPLRAVAS